MQAKKVQEKRDRKWNKEAVFESAMKFSNYTWALAHLT